MYVYFIAITSCKPRMVKIGKARNVESRLAELQVACPFQLELRGKLTCKSDMHALDIEGKLHRAFKHYAYRGEWFRYTQEVKYAIDSIVASGHIDSVNGFRGHIFTARSNRPQRIEPELPSDGIDYNRAFDRQFSATLRD